MNRSKKFRSFLAGVAALALMSQAAFAQVGPGPVTPANVPLGALITNTAQGAATVNSISQNNTYNLGALCTFNQASHTGTPSSTFSIQFLDRASASWQSLVTSGAVTADATPTTIIVYPGIQTASLPTGMVAFSGHLPRVWRVAETVAGTTPAVTGTVGCELLK